MKKDLLEHLPYLKKVVYLILKSTNHNDDVFQDCCVKIIETQSKFNNTGNVKAWMSAITRNTAITNLHKIHRKRKSINDNKEQIYKSTYLQKTNPDPTIDDAQIKILNDSFHVLTDRQKVIIEMRYYQNMKMADIANKCGVSQPTISNSIKMSLNKLCTEMIKKKTTLIKDRNRKRRK